MLMQLDRRSIIVFAVLCPKPFTHIVLNIMHAVDVGVGADICVDVGTDICVDVVVDGKRLICRTCLKVTLQIPCVPVFQGPP